MQIVDSLIYVFDGVKKSDWKKRCFHLTGLMFLWPALIVQEA